MRLRERVGLTFAALRVSGANGGLRLIQLARLASVTGRWAYTITLAVYAYASAGAGGVAVAGIARLAPAAIASPFAGTLIRRTSPNALLLRGGIARTVALAASGVVILLGGASAFVYLLVGLESAVSTVMRPVQNALVPALSETPQELTSTNLALSVIESAGVLLGPLLGAVLLHSTSFGIVFLASALAYLASALLLIPIRSIEPVETASHPKGLIADVTAGARAVAADRDTMVVVGLYGAQNLVAGALNVLIVVTALELLDLGNSGVGTLTAALGLGGVVGGGLVFARLRQGRHGVDLGLGLLLWGLPLVALALVSSEVAAFVLLGVVGIGVTVVDVAAVTLLQRNATGEVLPYAFGLLQTVFVASVAIGTLLAPVLVGSLGARTALVATGALLPLLAIALWRRLGELDHRARPDEHRMELLSAIPIFAPLPDPSLEHLASTLRPVTVPAGDVVVAQGDPGDGFYVIDDGDVDVRIDGEWVRTLGAGDHFGEIALLRNVRRTATIVARTDVHLLELEREQFLATVTGNAASSEAANAVVGTRLGLRTGLTSL